MPTTQKSFHAFLSANAAERFASSALAALLGFQVYATTHRALDLGLLGLAEALPAVTLVLHGGHIADRHSRKRIATAATFLLALAAAAVVAVSALPQASVFPGLLLVAFAAGIVRAYENPAATGLEAQVVPASRAVHGIALIATSSRLADVGGPIAAGFAWSLAGPTASYAAIALIFLAAALILAVGVENRTLPPRKSEPAWREIAEGVRYVVSDQILIGSMLLDLFAVFFGGATALLPIFATKILHAGAIGFGFLRASAGFGSLLAALTASRILPQRQAGIALHACVAAFGVAMSAFGLSRFLPLSLLALAVSGYADGMSVIIRRAILRLASPEAMRGRIGAMKSVFVGSSNELGAFESGLAASLIGASAAVWAGGVLTLAIAAGTWLTMGRLRRLDLVNLAEEAERPPALPPS